jgi:anti-sigma factor RsiW
MLAVSQHLETCRECADEFAAIQKVKVYLASLPRPISSKTLEERIQAQIDLEPCHTFSIPRWSMPRGLTAGPPQARRLATTFALSCVGLLAFAWPTGTSSVETALHPTEAAFPASLPLGEPAQAGATANPVASFALRPNGSIWSQSWFGRSAARNPFDDIHPFSFAPQSESGLSTSFASYSH